MAKSMSKGKGSSKGGKTMSNPADGYKGGRRGQPQVHGKPRSALGISTKVKNCS